nr:MAG TPA: hypothetical protein [Bacteriophage sp.]
MTNNAKDDLEMDKDVRFMESLEDNNKESEKKERSSSALNKFKRKFDSVVRRR